MGKTVWQKEETALYVSIFDINPIGTDQKSKMTQFFHGVNKIHEFWPFAQYW